MAPPDNIWAQMDYAPPRGACQHKDSLLSPKCACLRFMIHPSKVGSSFNCDGCNHHASFHQMENAAEKQVIERWRTEAVLRQSDITAVQRQAIEAAPSETTATGPKRKRPRRAIEAANDANSSIAGGGRSQTTRTTLDRMIDLEELPD